MWFKFPTLREPGVAGGARPSAERTLHDFAQAGSLCSRFMRYAGWEGGVGGGQGGHPPGPPPTKSGIWRAVPALQLPAIPHKIWCAERTANLLKIC
jgi:hypothetical protein